jgi:hypothetical protein
MVQDKQIARPGSRMYKGIEIPENATIHTNKHGREFYECGRDLVNKVAHVKMIDTSETLTIKLEIAERYLK